MTVSPTGAGQSISRCSTRPVSVISTSISRAGASDSSSTCRTEERVSDGYCTTATCRVSCASSRTVRATTSSRSTAPSRKFWIARRSGRGQRFDAGQLVDEEPVALVGGDTARAGVRLGDVALVLQDRHVVADGGGRHTELVPLGQRLGPDRLLGADVVLDDGTQHFESAFAQHRAPPAVGRRAFWPGTRQFRVPAFPQPVYGEATRARQERQRPGASAAGGTGGYARCVPAIPAVPGPPAAARGRPGTPGGTARAGGRGDSVALCVMRTVRKARTAGRARGREPGRSGSSSPPGWPGGGCRTST